MSESKVVNGENQNGSPNGAPNGRLVPFEGPSFTLMVPAGWLAVADQEFQASFIGPKIGRGRAGITIAISELAPTLSLADVVASMRNSQSATLDDYTVLMEGEVPNSDRPAMLRHFHWFNPDLDMAIIQRQLVVLTRSYAYAVTASQPNNPKRDSLDALYMQIIDSFRVGELEI